MTILAILQPQSPPEPSDARMVRLGTDIGPQTRAERLQQMREYRQRTQRQQSEKRRRRKAGLL